MGGESLRRQPADGADARLEDHEYDALLVVSFGGPEGPDDVIPFLENVTRGRNIPRERLAEVGHHYDLFGGVSPINRQNRELIAALESELEANGIALPVYYGNRNWHPFLTDTLRDMRDDVVHRALAFFTSAFSSYSSCRQYREDIYGAQLQAGADAPEVLKRLAAGAVARARRLRSPARAPRRRRHRRRRLAGRLRVRPHGGHVRPRHRS